MDKMRIGIIGCGKITLVRHGPECAANPRIELAGFTDRIFERAQAMADQFGGRAYPNQEALLADEKIDGVIVCTANTTHASVSLAALRAGKHVLCEKPVAVSVEEAVKMDAEARKAGKLLMIAQNQRFDLVNMRAKELLCAGAVGEMITFQAEFSHGGPEQWSIDATNSMYISKRESFLGALGDVGIHKIDLMRWMLDDEFTGVMANVRTLQKKDSVGKPLEVEDNALLILDTAKGRMGTLIASWTNYGRCLSQQFVSGTKGTMHISDSVTNSCILIERADGRSETYRFPAQPDSGVSAAFAEAALTGGPVPVTGMDGAKGMRVIMAALESSVRGGIRVVVEE